MSYKVLAEKPLSNGKVQMRKYVKADGITYYQNVTIQYLDGSLINSRGKKSSYAQHITVQQAQLEWKRLFGPILREHLRGAKAAPKKESKAEIISLTPTARGNERPVEPGSGAVLGKALQKALKENKPREVTVMGPPKEGKLAYALRLAKECLDKGMNREDAFKHLDLRCLGGNKVINRALNSAYGKPAKLPGILDQLRSSMSADKTAGLFREQVRQKYLAEGIYKGTVTRVINEIYGKLLVAEKPGKLGCQSDSRAEYDKFIPYDGEADWKKYQSMRLAKKRAALAS